MRDSMIEVQASGAHSRFEPARPVFDLGKEDPSILDAITARTPQAIAAIASVRNSIPLPKSARPDIDGRAYRLPSHNRSFCLALDDRLPLAASPVLVIKGTEPLLPDYPLILEWMTQAPLRMSTRVMADHFPLAEGKIPGALSLKEALREAEIALQIQQRHLEHYGELARIPTPVLVHEFTDESRNACALLLRHKVSRAAFDRIEALLKDGLAIYVYYYPSAPIRSNYWGDMGGAQFRNFFSGRIDEEHTIRSWVRLLVRLLYLGYLPYSVRNEGLGACMDFGNAVLDGGFCDPDSIVAVDSSADDEFFREGVIQSLAFLQNTVQLMLGMAYSGKLYSSIEDFVCRRYLQHLIEEAIVSEVRPGLHLDSRFSQLLSPHTLADVRLCATRSNRVAVYTQFAKRQARMPGDSQQGERQA